MIHPGTHLVHISEEKGYGVVAKQNIPRGTITWVHDKLDMVFTPIRLNALGIEYSEIMETYSFRNSNGDFVLCWDHGKYVNHSYNSNCLTTPYNFEIAIRNIAKGEELTDDYGYLNVCEPFEGIKEVGDRSMVYPDDLLNFYEVWDIKLSDSFQLIKKVEQPLFDFIPEKIISKIDRIIGGEEELESILNCYYDPN